MALCSSPVSHILRNFDPSIIDDLARENYTNWSDCIKSYLLSQDLWEVIEASPDPEPEDWRKKNAAALLAIQNSCEPAILSHIRKIIDSEITDREITDSEITDREITLAKDAWDTLAKIYNPETPPTYSGVPIHQFQPLYNAIKRGRCDQVNNFINSDLVKAEITATGRTALHVALHVACKAGDQSIIQKLKEVMLKKYSEIQNQDGARYLAEALAKQNQVGETALHVACEAGDVQIVEKLLEVMPAEALAKQNQVGETALHLACKAGHLRIIKKLAEVNQDGETALAEALAKQNQVGETALHVACEAGQWQIIEKLVEVMPAEALAKQNQVGETAFYVALHFACKAGHLQIIKKLAEVNQDGETALAEALAKQNQVGETALHVACEAGHLRIIKKLVEVMPAEALAKQNQVGETALHLACKAGHLPIIKKLAEVNQDGATALAEALAKQNQVGETALHVACKAGQLKIMVKLVEVMPAEALAKQNHVGETALDVACKAGHMRIIKKLAEVMIEKDLVIQNQDVETASETALQVMRVKALAKQNQVGETALHVACKAGHLKIAEKFAEDMPAKDLVIQNQDGETALHVACAGGHLKIVEMLVKLMSEADLEIKNQLGETALFNVARAGITKIAECMIKKNKNLASIKDGDRYLPVTIASIYCHKDMTRYLYFVTGTDLLFQDDNHGIDPLLSYSISNKIYDVALHLLSHCWKLTTARTITIPLVRLASMPLAFPSGSRLTLWQQWIYSCIRVPPPPTSSEVQAQPSAASSEVHVSISQSGQSVRGNIIRLPALSQLRRLVSNLLKFIIGIPHRLVSNLLKFTGIKEIYDMKETHGYALELLRFMCQEQSISNLDAEDAAFVATKHGIIEFIIEMLKVDIGLLGRRNDSGLTIFMSAIVHRQEKVISLLYGLRTSKYIITPPLNRMCKDMLHVAEMLAPATQLARISGAALQMQRELQWFQEVENISNPAGKEYLNCDGETPRQVFTKNHKDLVKEGEKWMKETASSCTVVGALIVTIMFAVAFTVPGGNDQNTGLPIFLHEKSFLVFIISDAISLFSSSTSVLMFLGILTSRYAVDDFLKSLPTKLIIGLSTLFVSIAAMMVAFSAALLIMLKGQLQIAIPIVLLASIPVTLYIWLQYRLFVDIFKSTYGPSIFDRKMKPWL